MVFLITSNIIKWRSEQLNLNDVFNKGRLNLLMKLYVIQNTSAIRLKDEISPLAGRNTTVDFTLISKQRQAFEAQKSL